MKNKMFINLLPIETERLLIDKTTVKDIDFILKIDKQEETQKYLGGIKNKSREERLLFLQKKEDKFLDGISSSLTVYLDSVPIGLVGLKIDEANNEGEISYIFDLDYTKKGYCTEVVDSLINICFKTLKLSCLKADTVEGNNGSIKVLIKNGFEYIDYSIKDEIKFNNYTLKNKFIDNV